MRNPRSTRIPDRDWPALSTTTRVLASRARKMSASSRDREFPKDFVEIPVLADRSGQRCDGRPPRVGGRRVVAHDPAMGGQRRQNGVAGGPAHAQLAGNLRKREGSPRLRPEQFHDRDPSARSVVKWVNEGSPPRLPSESYLNSSQYSTVKRREAMDRVGAATSLTSTSTI